MKIPSFRILPPPVLTDAAKPRDAAEMAQPALKPLAAGPVAALDLSPAARMLGLQAQTAAGPFGGGPAPLDAAAARKQEVIAAGRQFEAIFLRYLVTAMRNTGEGAGSGTEFYEGLIDENLSRILAESGGGLQLGELLARGMDESETESRA